MSESLVVLRFLSRCRFGVEGRPPPRKENKKARDYFISFKRAGRPQNQSAQPRCPPHLFPFLIPRPRANQTDV